MLIRETLEGLYFRLAAKHVDDDTVKKLNAILDEFDENALERNFNRSPEAIQRFHTMIQNLSKSPRLTRIIQSLYDLTHMVRLQYFSNPENVRQSLKFHRELLEALEKRDGDLAEKVRKNILRSTYKSLIELA